MSPKHLRDAAWFIDQVIPGQEEYRITKKLAEGQKGCVFVAHSGKLGRDVACKIIPEPNLIGPQLDPPSWMAEITNANQVSSQRVVKIFAVGPWQTPEGKCIYLLSDLVPGQSLRNYLREQKTVDFEFAVTLLQELLDFLRELRERRLVHGDLNSGNVLVEDRRAAFTGAPFGIRITDFGVAPVTAGAPLLDDFEQVAALLRETLALVDYQTLLAPDRLLFEFIRDDLLSKKLLEHDVSFDSSARDPRALFTALSEARQRSTRTAGSTRKTLTTPFDYLSCEQIGEAHALLKELYSDKMLGLQQIEDLNNLVLTGPRGCGKTTVFRCLSMKHLVSTDDDALESVKYIALYYRCDDLYYSFPRYSLPSNPLGYDVPMHFLTVTLLRELLESLLLWLPRRASASWTRSEAAAAKALWELTGLSKPAHPSAHTFRALVNGLEKERGRAAYKQRFVNDSKHAFGVYFGPDLLLRACTTLADHFVELAQRPIFFLIDDYSTPKISADLQRNLNRLVMQRSARGFFKLATESPASFLSSDMDDKTYVEGREFRLVNIGMDFINATAEDKLRFVDDVFTKRFSYAERFPLKTLQAFVGDNPARDYNEHARQLRAGKYPYVWGRHALAELCSGDVHYLIDLAGKMVTAVGGADGLSIEEGTPAIPPNVQHKTIRTEGGNFLRNLRALPHGPALVEIVESFGQVAASFVRHRDSKNEANAPPHQAARIEPLEDPKLAGEAKEIYDELLRYSVFLEDVRGKSRRGLVVPRLYLRRFLIPFFNLTFSKRDSMELDVVELKELLLKPREFESRKRLRGPETVPTAADNGKQLPLLPSGSDE
jgi:serine/threonine protein kinase